MKKSKKIICLALLKKTNVIANLSQTTNINKRHEILKGEFSKSLKKDEKLFWWLLLDPLEKIVSLFNFNDNKKLLI